MLEIIIIILKNTITVCCTGSVVEFGTTFIGGAKTDKAKIDRKE